MAVITEYIPSSAAVGRVIINPHGLDYIKIVRDGMTIGYPVDRFSFDNTGLLWVDQGVRISHNDPPNPPTGSGTVYTQASAASSQSDLMFKSESGVIHNLTEWPYGMLFVGDNAATTALPLNTPTKFEEFDDHRSEICVTSLISQDITPTKTYLYKIEGSLTVESGAGRAANVLVEVYKNGGTPVDGVAARQAKVAGIGAPQNVALTGIDVLDATDNVYLVLTNTTNAAPIQVTVSFATLHIAKYSTRVDG